MADITGTPGNDVIELTSPSMSDQVDLGEGFDRIVLADGGNTLFVTNTEVVQGGRGDELVFVRDDRLETFTGGAGADQVIALGTASLDNLVTSSVERVFGSAADERLTYNFGGEDPTQISDIFMGEGNDFVSFFNLVSDQALVDMSGVEAAEVVAGKVTMRLGNPASGFSVVSSEGAEGFVVLGAFQDSPDNVVYSQGQNRIQGAEGRDTVYVRDASLTDFNGLQGYDTIEATGAGSELLLRDVENVKGTSGADKVVLFLGGGQQQFAHDVALGDGVDSLNIVNSGLETVTVYAGDVESIAMDGAVNLYLQGRAFGTGIITEVGATSRIFLEDVGGFKTANLVELRGDSQVNGSSGRDIVQAQAGTDGSFYALADGQDRLELVGSGRHVATVTGVEAVLGSVGADILRLVEDTPDRMSIDLGGGNDTLFLSDAGGSVLVSNVEAVIGNTNQDTVTVRTSAKGMVLDLDAGFDRVFLGAVNNSLTIRNTEFVVGGAGVDRITVVEGDNTSVFVNAQGGGDVLIGGGGDDVLIGGLGKDLMTGGAGADTFLFERVADSDLNTRDIIYDFQPGQDRLEFQGLLSGKFELTVEQAFTAFQANGNSQAHFVDSTDQLLIDSNGDGAMDMRMALLGVDGSQLTTADFMWSVPMGGPPGGGGPGPFLIG